MLQLTLVAFCVTLVVSNVTTTLSTFTNNVFKEPNNGAEESSGSSLLELIRQERVYELQRYWKILETMKVIPPKRRQKRDSTDSSQPFSCRPVKCTYPPDDANCTIADKHDESINRPKGPKSLCCPLYKCRDKDGIFPYHGAFGRGPSKNPHKNKNDENSNLSKSSATGSDTFSCSSVSCQFPPNDASCVIPDKSDMSIPHPKGQKAGCCPLYKCTSSDGSMFPFHGAFGRGPPLSKGRQRESEEQQSSLAPKSDSVRKEESSSCGKVNCEQAPVMESKCRMLDPDDNTFPRPQGRHSTCCPMFRCENSDGSSFSFHGAFGRGPTTLSQKSMFEFKTTTPSPNDVCSEVHCQFPPFDSQCSIVDVLDTNVKRPKGKTAKCCNLFNCKNKDGSSFPFHGVYGKGPIKPPPTLEKQEENFSCKEVHCQFPPNDAKCTLHDKSDDSIQQPKGNKKSCCGGALYKCVNDDGSYFPFHGAFGRGPVKGSEKIKKTTTPTPPPSSSTAFPPRTTTPFSSMAMPFTFPTIDFGMNMFKENSKSSTLPQSIKSTTVAPITTTTPASLFKEPKMDFNFPMMAMDMNMGMSNFGASSKTTTPIPSSTFGRLSTTTPSSLSKEPEFPKMDFSFPMMSMDMGMGMSNFGASSKTTTPIPPSKFGVLSTPASVLIATPATKTTTSRPATTTQFSSMIKEMEFPKMDFPSMDFGMSGFGDSSSKSKTTTPSPFSTSIKKPDLTSTASPFPTMEMPSMDFNMMDMKMPSMDFPSMTSMTPSTNKTGENGNVNVMKVVDKTNGNVETNVVATGGEDAVAFATDGGGDTSDADIAAMQKEMDAMSASMNMNMMMKKKRETE